MPHYQDGTVAQVGDFVVGKGYNVKDAEGELATIAGTVIFINESTEACNIQVAYTKVYDQPQSGPVDQIAGHKILPDQKISIPGVEYGQTDHFEKVG